MVEPQGASAGEAETASPALGQTAPTESTLVEFAAGGVKFALPDDWSVSEEPYRREVRLSLQPRNESVVGGAWLTYHVRDQTNVEQAGRMLRDRLQGDLPGVVLSEPRTINVSGNAGLLFTYAHAAPNQQRQGWRAMIAVPWGYVEMHVFASPESWTDIAADVRALFNTLELGATRLPPTELADEVRDAAPIVGVWKAYRSRMRLLADGRIFIEHDRVIDVSLQQRYNTETLPTQNRIAGRYVAQGDVLQVVWEDGSELNYRWRLSEWRLLLTDHEGLVSQLYRLLETPEPQQP